MDGDALMRLGAQTPKRSAGSLPQVWPWLPALGFVGLFPRWSLQGAGGFVEGSVGAGGSGQGPPAETRLESRAPESLRAPGARAAPAGLLPFFRETSSTRLPATRLSHTSSVFAWRRDLEGTEPAGLSASPPLVPSAQGTFLSTSSSVEHECSGLFVFF